MGVGAPRLPLIYGSLDLYIGLVRTEELDEMGQVMAKVLKNRYGEQGYKFVLGVDFSKSLLHDVEQSAQHGIHQTQPTNDEPMFDRSRKSVNADKFKF